MSGITVPCLVRPCGKSDKELNALLFLSKKTKRQAQKIMTLSKYVQKYPSGWKKRLELAELLYERGEWEQAVEEYLIVMGRRPQLIQVRLKLGKILQLMGRVEEATYIYEQGLSLCHNQATIFHLQGKINLWRGQFERALKEFESAIAIEPDNPSHYLALGRIQQSRGDFTAALKSFEQILELRSDDLVALLHSYDVLLAAGNIKAAEDILCRAELAYPFNYCVLIRRLAERLKIESFQQNLVGDKTEKILALVMKLAPHSVEVRRLSALYHRTC